MLKKVSDFRVDKYKIEVTNHPIETPKLGLFYFYKKYTK
jgi:hypothetical protein